MGLRSFWFIASLAMGFTNLLSAQSEQLDTLEIRSRTNRVARPEASSEFPGARVDLNQFPAGRRRDAIEQIPSISVQSSDGESGEPQIRIRGQEMSQSRFFLEDMPLTDAQSNVTRLNLVPFEQIRSWEVYPEGVPSVLADDGLGGAAQLRLYHPAELPGTVGTENRVGSFGYWRTAVWTGSGASRNLSVHLDYARSEENFSYFDDNGTPLNPADDSIQRRDNNRFSRITLFPRGEWSLGRFGNLSVFSLNHFGNRRISGPVSGSAPGTLENTDTIQSLRWIWTTGQHQFTAIGYAKTGSDTIHADDSAKLVGLEDSRQSKLGAGGLLRHHADWGPAWRGDLVVGVKTESASVTSPQRRVAGRRSDVPVGAALRFRPVEGWDITPAVTASRVSYSGDIAREFFSVSPRVGSAVTLSRSVSVRASAGRYFRLPTIDELYGSPWRLSANPGLLPESAIKWETGLDTTWDLSARENVRASYTFSHTSAQDLVVAIPNSQQTFILMNIGRADIQMHEFAAQLRARYGLEFNGSLAFYNSTNRSAAVAEQGNALPLRPGYRAGVGLGLRGERWRVLYQLQRVGGVYWDVANTKYSGATSVHDVYLGWSSREFGTLSFEIKNLFDQITVDTLVQGQTVSDNSTAIAGFPAPGRRFYVTWSYTL